MLSILVSLTISEIVLGIVGAATAALTVRWWAGRPWIGIAFGLTGIGVAGILSFVILWLVPKAELPLTIVLVGGGLVVLVVLKAWRWWRVASPLILLIGGISLAYVGVFALWGLAPSPFDLAATRFGTAHTLPVDNQLPWIFGQFLAEGKSTHLFSSSWNGSDRPPLLTGLVGLMQPVLLRLDLSPSVAGFGPSVAGQLLWIPAIWALARVTVRRRRAARYAVVFVAALGTTLLNTLYTWPKMTSAAMVIVAIVLIIELRRRRGPLHVPLCVAVLAFVLGLLSHGAAAFAAPLLVVLGLQLIRRRGWRPVSLALVPAVVAAALVYLPWVLFQRLADPPGDRLLKWHLAGVIPIDSRSFLQALRDSYSALSPGEWLSGRLINLETVFSPMMFAGIGGHDPVAARRDAEFFYTSAALGTTVVVLVVVVILIAVRLLRRRADALDRLTSTLLVGSLLCILVWCLVMFIPGATIVHQGSQVWIFLLAVVPALWIWARSPRWAWIAFAAQLVEVAAVYLPNLTGNGLFLSSVPVALLGVGLVAASFVRAPMSRTRARVAHGRRGRL